MQKKESFLLSLDDEVLFNRLTDEQAGKLIKAIFLYEKTGETSNLEFGLDLAFTTIQVKLDKNREKYKAKCEKNKENANKRWEKYNRIGTHTNNADNDYDMTLHAGVGVVMANGSDKTKSVADYITDDNDHDGIGKFIEKHIL